MPFIGVSGVTGQRTFTTTQELEAYVAELCDAAEKGRCYRFIDDNGTITVFLPDGQYIPIQPS